MGNFFGELDGKRSKKNISVTDYMILENDKPIKIQFLSKPKRIYKHWIYTDGKKLPFNCLGIGCSVCSRNLEIMDEVGEEEARKNPQFFNREEKFVANVLDLTPVKICPKCETVNDKVAAKCSGQDCGNIIIEIEPRPLKMVRYLEGSYTMYKTGVEEPFKMVPGIKEDQIEELITKTPLSLKKYKGSNDKVGYAGLPLLNDPDAVNPEDYVDQLFDKFGISVSHEEMVILMNGGSFKEVMTSRSKDSEMKREVDSLFKD